jgi:hypothetical protein
MTAFMMKTGYRNVSGIGPRELGFNQDCIWFADGQFAASLKGSETVTAMRRERSSGRIWTVVQTFGTRGSGASATFYPMSASKF